MGSAQKLPGIKGKLSPVNSALGWLQACANVGGKGSELGFLIGCIFAALLFTQLLAERIRCFKYLCLRGAGSGCSLFQFEEKISWCPPLLPLFKSQCYALKTIPLFSLVPRLKCLHAVFLACTCVWIFTHSRCNWKWLMCNSFAMWLTDPIRSEFNICYVALQRTYFLTSFLTSNLIREKKNLSEVLSQCIISSVSESACIYVCIFSSWTAP